MTTPTDNQPPSPDQIARLAINRDWTTDINDPPNAYYLKPFGSDDREDEAHDMAANIYNAIAAERFTEATSQAEADATYFQCLVDARRMLFDPEYEDLFRGAQPDKQEKAMTKDLRRMLASWPETDDYEEIRDLLIDRQSVIRKRASRRGYQVVHMRGRERDRRRKLGIGTYMLLGSDQVIVFAATLTDIAAFLNSPRQ